MKNLWTFIDKKDWSEKTKYKAVSLILGILSALAGLVLWLLIRKWVLSGWDWMICFVGYSAVLSWFAVFFYSCGHDFHNGAVHE